MPSLSKLLTQPVGKVRCASTFFCQSRVCYGVWEVPADAQSNVGACVENENMEKILVVEELQQTFNSVFI